MSNGDLWSTPDGQKGIEVRRTERTLYLSIIKDDWPFPDSPKDYPKHQCRRIPNRYNGVDDAEEAPF
jgi:hypothetical protein